MKKILWIFVILLILLIFSIATIFIIGIFTPKTTNPVAKLPPALSQLMEIREDYGQCKPTEDQERNFIENFNEKQISKFKVISEECKRQSNVNLCLEQNCYWRNSSN